MSLSGNIKIIAEMPRPKPSAIFLFSTAAFLTLASLLEVLAEYAVPSVHGSEVYEIFDTKGVAPTAFLVFLLLICSFLLGLISEVAAKNKHERSVWSWRVLSVIFLFLSCDELLEIHHQAAGRFGVLFSGSSWFSYKWVLVYTPFVLLFGFGYLKFLARLPVRIRKLFVLSGIITLFGAYILEISLAALDHLYGYEGLAYGLFAVFKKSLELFGISIFVYALLSYIDTFRQSGEKSRRI